MIITSGSYTIGLNGDFSTLVEFLSSIGPMTGNITGTFISYTAESSYLFNQVMNGYTLTIRSDVAPKDLLTSGYKNSLGQPGSTTFTNMYFRFDPASDGSFVFENMHLTTDNDATDGFISVVGFSTPTYSISITYKNIIWDNNNKVTTGLSTGNFSSNKSCYVSNILGFNGGSPLTCNGNGIATSVVENVTTYDVNIGLACNSCLVKNCVCVNTLFVGFVKDDVSVGYNNASSDDSVDDSSWNIGSGNITNVVASDCFESVDTSDGEDFLLPKSDGPIYGTGINPTSATEYINGLSIISDNVDIGAKGLLRVTMYISPTVQFINQPITFSADVSGCDSPEYLWDFDNGDSNNEISASYTYSDYGQKDVSFKVTCANISENNFETLKISRLPSPSYTGTLSAGEDITFTDVSAPFYFAGTVVSADWNFGDGSTSSTTDLTASLVHQYTGVGNYTVSVTAYDVSGNEGVASTNVPLFSTLGNFCTLSADYIKLCGPEENARYGDSRDINLVEYLPLYLRGGETESFLQLFEDFLNEMFDGLDGFPTTATELTVTKGYESTPTDDNWPRENTYEMSATSADEETDATDVQSISIGNPDNVNNQKISILEKVNRIAELHDPDLIDLEYIQYFASNLGYDIDINRNEVGVSGAGDLGTTGDFGDDSPCLSADSNKYLRFTIRNLPTWYKIKSTNNAIKVMLYSFGLVGDLIEYYTDTYDSVANGGKWRLDYEGEFTDLPDGWFPTPHFAISVNIDESADISLDVSRRQKVINAIESLRPINTVFQKLSAYVSRVTNIYVGSVMRFRRYIQIEPDGWANNWADENGDPGTPPEDWTANPL